MMFIAYGLVGPAVEKLDTDGDITLLVITLVLSLGGLTMAMGSFKKYLMPSPHEPGQKVE